MNTTKIVNRRCGKAIIIGAKKLRVGVIWVRKDRVRLSVEGGGLHYVDVALSGDVQISEEVRVTLLSVTNGKVRLAITTPRTTKIHSEEQFEANCLRQAQQISNTSKNLGLGGVL